MELLEWYNLVFVAPIGLAGIYLVLSATGLGTETGHDMDHDAEVDMDHDVDMDMDHDVDMDMDHDVHVDVDHDLDVGHDVDHDVAMEGVEHEVHDGHVAAQQDHSLMIRALSVLGFGKVPVSILMTCLMVIFGAVGLICNGLFASVFPWQWAPEIYFWPSFGVAGFAALSLTGATARGINRIMPTSETYVIKASELVGRVGISVYGLAEGQRGVVSVKDESGTLHRVSGHAVDAAIGKDKEIIVVRYHREGDYYDVSESPL